jgi:hypothetical protein
VMPRGRRGRSQLHGHQRRRDDVLLTGKERAQPTRELVVLQAPPFDTNVRPICAGSETAAVLAVVAPALMTTTGKVRSVPAVGLVAFGHDDVRHRAGRRHVGGALVNGRGLGRADGLCVLGALAVGSGLADIEHVFGLPIEERAQEPLHETVALDLLPQHAHVTRHGVCDWHLN